MEYDFAPKEWFFIYDLFEYLLKNKNGKMPKISEKEVLPDVYSIKEKKESEDVIK